MLKLINRIVKHAGRYIKRNAKIGEHGAILEID